MENLDLNLNFPEVDYRDFIYYKDSLTFTALDLVGLGNPLEYEIVKVSITNIVALRITLSPFRNGEYGESFTPVDFGNASEQDGGFEGIIYENPFTDEKAKYYWISSDYRGCTVTFDRTGEFEYKHEPSRITNRLRVTR